MWLLYDDCSLSSSILRSDQQDHVELQDRTVEKALLKEAEELHLFALDLAIQRLLILLAAPRIHQPSTIIEITVGVTFFIVLISVQLWREQRADGEALRQPGSALSDNAKVSPSSISSSLSPSTSSSSKHKSILGCPIRQCNGLHHHPHPLHPPSSHIITIYIIITLILTNHHCQNDCRYQEAEKMHLKAIQIKESLLGLEDYEVIF